jgi:hypothetical protein
VTRAAHSTALTLVAIAGAAAIAACGAERPAPAPTVGQVGQALTYVRCMRAQGVPDFPDPSPGGRLPNIPSSIDTVAPAFQSAQKACAGLMPGGGGSGSPADTGTERLGFLAVARCMRAHGFPNFPDPTTTPPPPPPPGADAGNVIGGPGAYLHLPPQSPALTRAVAACGFRIP